MKKTIFAILVLQTLSAPLAFAGETKAYISRDGFWSRPAIMVDDKAVNCGFTGLGKLAEAMKSNPEASAYADNAHSDAVLGNSFFFGGLGGILGYALFAPHFDPTVYWSIFLAGVIPGIIFQDYAQLNLNKAFNSYNGVGVKKSAFHPDRMMVSPTPDGALANLGWSF